MRKGRFLWLFNLILAMILFNACPGGAQTSAGVSPEPERRGPVITHAFAVEKGYYGIPWKIYLEAEDPGGQMLKIALVVDQVGYGRYPTDWIYLKPRYQKHFKGYIQWNTFSSKSSYLPEWTQITLTVSVVDKAGKESNEVIFPYTFEITPGQYAYTPPPPFDQEDLTRLGYIAIDLHYPGREDEHRGPGTD